MAAAVPFLAPVVGGLVGMGAAKLLAPKPKAAPKAAEIIAPRPITRNDAVDARMRDDERRRRRGSAANIITGMGGAEASSGGGKQLLGQ